MGGCVSSIRLFQHPRSTGKTPFCVHFFHVLVCTTEYIVYDLEWTRASFSIGTCVTENQELCRVIVQLRELSNILRT